jgi:hypothetical protein
MRAALLRAYRRIPEPVRDGLRPLAALEELSSFLPPRPRRALEQLTQGCRSLSAVRRYRAPVVCLHGASRVDGAPLRVVLDLAGEGYAYWSDLLFAAPPEREVVGEVCGPLGFLESSLPPADLTLLRHNRLARRRARARGFACVPTWVQLFLDTRRPLDAILEGGRSGRNSRKNDVRRVRAKGYRATLVRDSAEVRAFFADWYLPFSQARWGASLVRFDRDLMRRLSRTCELLWIERDGARVSAALLEPHGRLLRCVAFGLRDPEAVREGALAACYWLMIEHAVARGYETLRLGGSRPVMSDGALRHKLKWGGALGAVRQWDYLAVRVDPQSAVLRALLAVHPLVAEDAGRFLALTSEPRPPEAPTLEPAHGLAGLLVPGADGWVERPLA